MLLYLSGTPYSLYFPFVSLNGVLIFWSISSAFSLSEFRKLGYLISLSFFSLILPIWFLNVPFSQGSFRFYTGLVLHPLLLRGKFFKNSLCNCCLHLLLFLITKLLYLRRNSDNKISRGKFAPSFSIFSLNATSLHDKLQGGNIRRWIRQSLPSRNSPSRKEENNSLTENNSRNVMTDSRRTWHTDSMMLCPSFLTNIPEHSQ